MTKTCFPCLKNHQNPPKTSLTSWPISDSPFERVHIDFFGPFHGKMYLIMYDSFSKWIEVFPMTRTTSEATEDCLRHIFARFSLPKTLVSDNGPQFTSEILQFFF